MNHASYTPFYVATRSRSPQIAIVLNTINDTTSFMKVPNKAANLLLYTAHGTPNISYQNFSMLYCIEIFTVKKKKGINCNLQN